MRPQPDAATDRLRVHGARCPGSRRRVALVAVLAAVTAVATLGAGCSGGSDGSATSTSRERGGSGSSSTGAATTTLPPRPTTTTTRAPTPSQAATGGRAAEALKGAAVAVMIPVWRDDPGHRGQRDATVGAFTALGGEVDDGVRFPPGTTDFASTVATLEGKVRMARGMGQRPLAVYVVGGSDTDGVVAALRASPDLGGVLLFDSDGARLDG